MTLGLFPPMLLIAFWNPEWKRSPLSFGLPIVVSLVIGVAQSARTTCLRLLDGACVEWDHEFAPGWAMGKGPNALNLGLSVYTVLLCTLAAIVGFAVDQQFRCVPRERLSSAGCASGAALLTVALLWCACCRNALMCFVALSGALTCDARAGLQAAGRGGR
eukprot:3244097-Rhodomonas_salina.1